MYFLLWSMIEKNFGSSYPNLGLLPQDPKAECLMSSAPTHNSLPKMDSWKPI